VPRIVRVHDVRETVQALAVWAAMREQAALDSHVLIAKKDQGDAGMTRKYFGTDGIRGTVGQAPITPDFVLRLAMPWAGCCKRSEAATRRC
jgi:hypothetical protein